MGLAKDRLQRSIARHLFEGDYQMCVDQRLKDVSQLARYLEIQEENRTADIKINAGCVFFNSNHREKVQELTIKQVLQGLEKNYNKFKDHYSKVVKAHPAILKEPELPCMKEIREKEKEDQSKIDFYKVLKERPKSVEYLLNDESTLKLFSQKYPEFNKTLITEDVAHTNFNRVDSGVSVRKNFVPPLKVAREKLPKVGKQLPPDVIHMTVDKSKVAGPKKDSVSMPAVKRDPAESKAVKARMNKLYKNNFGEMLINAEMRVGITREMMDNIKAHHENIEKREMATNQIEVDYDQIKRVGLSD